VVVVSYTHPLLILLVLLLILLVLLLLPQAARFNRDIGDASHGSVFENMADLKAYFVETEGGVPIAAIFPPLASNIKTWLARGLTQVLPTPPTPNPHTHNQPNVSALLHFCLHCGHTHDCQQPLHTTPFIPYIHSILMPTQGQPLSVLLPVPCLLHVTHDTPRSTSRFDTPALPSCLSESPASMS